MARDERTRRDAAGVGPDPEFSRRLYPIDELKDYRIASGEPDVRGWSVRTLNGREMGEVEDLLIDPTRGEVVMLEVDLDHSGRHVAVPLRSVQVDRARKCVVVDSSDVDPERASVYDQRVRDRMTDEDRRVLADETRDVRSHDVRYEVADRGAVDEKVVERRPVVEEVVVRRRDVEVEDEDIT
jgi:sporulation protein YlmC with PRC-barrel domain